jgi:hypothetical protein
VVLDMQKNDNRTEAALYWSAVSLIVCEGLPIDKAAEQLGVEGADLRDILYKRQALRPNQSFGPLGPQQSATVVPFTRH